jgi:hypothetical protein
VVSHALDTGDYVPVGRYPFELRLAAPGDLDEIYELIDEAAAWLRDKGTDQWERPWPSREARHRRVLSGLENGETWIVWDGSDPVATITTATQPNPKVWSNLSPECDLSERAVYVHRLIAARRSAGSELGSELIDWAGLHGHCLYGAQWIRVDVWSSNLALHDYYLARGFLPCGRCADPYYPSGALFQKPVLAIRPPSLPPVHRDLVPLTSPAVRSMAHAFDRPEHSVQDRRST